MNVLAATTQTNSLAGPRAVLRQGPGNGLSTRFGQETVDQNFDLDDSFEKSMPSPSAVESSSKNSLQDNLSSVANTAIYGVMTSALLLLGLTRFAR